MLEIFDFLKENPEVAAMLVSLVVAIIQAVRERMKAKDAILLLLNTLKDEGKQEQGKQFTTATIKKLEEVAEYTDATKDTIEHVKETISEVNREKGIKIGSYKGKPIYLRDAAQVAPVGKALGAALGVLRGIIRR